MVTWPPVVFQAEIHPPEAFEEAFGSLFLVPDECFDTSSALRSASDGRAAAASLD